jgi:hypothetical protein
MSDLASLIGRYKPGNQFAERAARARLAYERLAPPSAHDKAMANAFPLGAGFGRKGAAKRMDQTINRAVGAVQALQEATYREGQAQAFDRGEINAQGRRVTREGNLRSEKRGAANVARKERIEKARKERGDKEPWQLLAVVYADSTGYLAGGARRLIESEHREAVEQALAAGKDVPEEVRAEHRASVATHSWGIKCG